MSGFSSNLAEFEFIDHVDMKIFFFFFLKCMKPKKSLKQHQKEMQLKIMISKYVHEQNGAKENGYFGLI